jgi:hypothetical protein
MLRSATEEGMVQDRTEDSTTSVQASPQTASLLVELVEIQAANLEAAAGQIGYMQAQLASPRKVSIRPGEWAIGRPRILPAFPAFWHFFHFN